MTTENPAMKALEVFNQLTSHPVPQNPLDELQIIWRFFGAHADTIRTALSQSAKVNVLLETLQKISRMKTMPDHASNTFTLSMAHKLADDAISQFHATEGSDAPV